MNNHKLYEVIWNPQAAIDLKEYVKYAKTTIDKIYDLSNMRLQKNPHKKGVYVEFKNFEYNGYYWTNIHNIILVYEIIETERIVVIEASFYANNELSAQIFYDIDPDEGW